MLIKNPETACAGKREGKLMKKIVAAAVITAVLTMISFVNSAEAIHTGWFAPDWASELKNKFTGKSDAAEGKKIYKKNCAKCHGTSGRGGGPSAGSLQIELPDFSNKEIAAQESDGEWFWKIRTGLFEMPPFQVILSDDDIWKVTTYVRTLAQ